MSKTTKKYAAPHAGDDTVVYKVMAAVAAACAAVCILVRVIAAYRTAGGMVQIYDALLIAMWIALAVAVVFAVGAVALRRRRGLCYASGFVSAVGLLSFASCLMLRLYWVSAAAGCYFLWIAAALLYCLYMLYPREFFVIALLTAAAGGTFYLLSRVGTSRLSILAVAVLTVLSVLCAVLTFLAARTNGRLRIGKRTVQLFSVNFAAIPLYITCALWPLCGIAALLLGSVFAYYCIYVAVGSALIAVCYYTFKLM